MIDPQEKISYQDEDQKISYETPEPLLQLPDKEVNDRALKFEAAWPPDSKTGMERDTAKTMLTSGQEGDLRQQLSNEVQLKDQRLKIGLLQDLARHKAENSDQGLTEGESAFVMGTPDPSKYDPQTIMEQELGRKMLSASIVQAGDPEHPLNVAQQGAPQLFHNIADIASETASKNSLLVTLKQNNDSQISSEGWIPWGGQVFKTLVPFWNASDIAGASPDAVTSRFMPGDMLREQAIHDWSLPLSEFNKQVQVRLEKLDPMERSQYLDYMLNFSPNERMMSNAGAMADLASAFSVAIKIGGIVKGGAAAYRGSQDIKAVQDALKDTAKVTEDVANAVATRDPVKTAEALGDIKAAGRLRLWEKWTAPFNQSEKFEMAGIAKDIPSLWSPQSIVSNLGNFSREFGQRLEDHMIGNSEAIINMFTDARKMAINRLGPDAMNKAFGVAEDGIWRQFQGTQDAVLDIRRIKPDQDMPGVARVEVSLGRPNGEFFKSPGEANRYAERYGLPEDSYFVDNNGSGFYISIKRAVNETEDAVRNMIIETANNDPESIANSLWGRLRSAADVLPFLQRENRMIAETAPNQAKEYLQSLAKDMNSLSKNERKELLRLASVGRDMTNPIDKSKRGYFFRNVGEFESAFQALHSRPPTEGQVRAYQTYVQLNDAEYLMRNWALLRDKERQGIENLRFQFHNGQDTTINPWFEGRVVDDLPWNNTEDFGVLKIHAGSKPETILDRSELAAEKELIQQGKLRVIQVAHPAGRPLAEAAENQHALHYVLTENFDRKPLSWHQIEYNPGGHSIYPQQVFAKQPILEKGYKGLLNYFGDKNILNTGVMSQGQKYAELLDEGRLLLKGGREAELPGLVARGLPMTVDQFKQMFKEGGHLSLDHPIVAVRSGERALDGTYKGQVLKNLDTYNGEKVRDQVYSSYNLYSGLDKEFLQDRDAILPTVKFGEREGDTLFHLSPSKQLDPFAALQRGLGGAIRQRWLNDYKTSAIEQWIAKWSPLFSQGKLSYVRGNPVYFFFHPQFKESQWTYGDIQRALAARDQIVNFLGIKTELGNKLDWVRWKATDAIYDALSRVSPKYSTKFANSDFVTNFLTPGAIDPARYMRSMAFHQVIGLFNPMRYLLHAAYSTHVLAIMGPTRGYQGMAFSGLMQYLLMHPHFEGDEQLVNHVAGLISKMGGGWTVSEAKEAAEALRVSGWHHVGNESAWKQDLFDPKIFTSTAGRFLDSGTWFFRKGEQFARLSAFGAAYKEWKAANPVAQLGSREIGQVLRRAEDLSLNMTRASLAGWQRGWTGLTAQFMTYNIRLMEQLLPGILGKSTRITQGEALRAVMIYSTLFGIPATVGGISGFFPAYESVEKAALDRGINLHESWKGLFTDGILSSAIRASSAMFGGSRDYNVAERYGPNADKNIYDAIMGNKTIGDVLVGPSGQMMEQMFKSALPGLKGFYDWVADDGEQYPIRPTDLLDFTRNIGAVSQGFKWWAAANFGKYYARNGRLIDDKLDAWDGAIMGLTGVTPTRIITSTLMQQILRDDKANMDKVAAQYTTDFQRAMRAYADGNPELAQTFLQRAKTDLEAGGFTAQQRIQLQRRAVSEENLTEIMKTRQDFWKYSPESRQKARQDMIQQMNQGEPQ